MSDEIRAELREVVNRMVVVYLEAIDCPEDEKVTVHTTMMGPVLTVHIGVGEQARLAMTLATAAARAVDERHTHLHTTPSGQDPDRPEIPRILL